MSPPAPASRRRRRRGASHRDAAPADRARAAARPSCSSACRASRRPRSCARWPAARASDGARGDRFVDVTGDEQLTAHALVGDVRPADGAQGRLPARALRPWPARPRDARRRDPLRRGAQPGAERRPQRAAHRAVGPLPRGPAARARRGATPGSPSSARRTRSTTSGTARLSRGLADRFLVLELDYQPRDEELEIVRRRSGPARAGLHPFAVDIARASREHAGPAPRRVACAARSTTPTCSPATSCRSSTSRRSAPRLQRLRRPDARQAVGRPDGVPDRARDHRRDPRARLRGQRRRRCSSTPPPRRSATRPTATPTAAGRRERRGRGAAWRTGDRPPDEDDRALARRTRSRACRGRAAARPGESRSVPMVDRDQPAARGARVRRARGRPRHAPARPRGGHARRRASSTCARARGSRAPPGPSGLQLHSTHWTDGRSGHLDVDATIGAYVAGRGDAPARGLPASSSASRTSATT